MLPLADVGDCKEKRLSIFDEQSHYVIENKGLAKRTKPNKANFSRGKSSARPLHLVSNSSPLRQSPYDCHSGLLELSWSPLFLRIFRPQMFPKKLYNPLACIKSTGLTWWGTIELVFLGAIDLGHRARTIMEKLAGQAISCRSRSGVRISTLSESRGKPANARP